MLFNSLQFLVFLPIVFFLFYLLPHKYRWAMLLVASIYFYMAFIPVYILVLGLTIVIDYWAGIKIERARSSRKRFFLIFSLVSTGLVLFLFKYFNFFNTNFEALAGFLDLHYPIPLINIILPIGL